MAALSRNFDSMDKLRPVTGAVAVGENEGGRQVVEGQGAFENVLVGAISDSLVKSLGEELSPVFIQSAYEANLALPESQTPWQDTPGGPEAFLKSMKGELHKRIGAKVEEYTDQFILTCGSFACLFLAYYLQTLTN